MRDRKPWLDETGALNPSRMDGADDSGVGAWRSDGTLGGGWASRGIVLCATVPPPKELTEARTSYERAQGGPSGKLAPAALDTAKQALQKAERIFRDQEDSPETRALAYIADRKARLAEAMAAIAQAGASRSSSIPRIDVGQAGTFRRGLS